MSRSNRRLLSDEIRNFFKFAAVNVTVAIQVKHFKGDFEVTTRG
jgi:hypothetical protein